MILLGITGPIGHGKTTFADALAALVHSVTKFESFLVVAEVADALHAATVKPPDPHNLGQINEWLRALPDILNKHLRIDCTFDQIKLDQTAIETHPVEYQKLLLHLENLHRNPKLIQQKITRENKETYRPFLQWLGGYLVKKVDPGIWYNELVRRVRQAAAQGTELCIVSGLRFPTDASMLRAAGGRIIKIYRPGHLQNDMLDPTERERDNIQADATVMSNGDVADLQRIAAQVLEDLRANRLQPLYQAKSM